MYLYFLVFFTFLTPLLVFAEGPDYCQDLYSAVCLNEKGEPLYSQRIKETGDNLIVQRDKLKAEVIRSYGFSSADEASYKGLELRGYKFALPALKIAQPDSELEEEEAVVAGWDNKVAQVQVQKTNEAPQKIESPHLLPRFGDCNKLIARSHITSGKLNSTPDHREIYESVQKLKVTLHEAAIDLYSDNLEQFVNAISSSLCSINPKSGNVRPPVSEGPEKYGKPMCPDWQKARIKAVDIYRKKNSIEYKRESREFVAELIYNFKSSNKAESELDEIKRTCEIYNFALSSALSVEGNEFEESVMANRKMVEGLIDIYYPARSKAKLEAELAELTERTKVLVSTLYTDPRKRREAVEQFGKFKLDWFDRPPSTVYKKDKYGKEVLDAETVTENAALVAFFKSKTIDWEDVNATFTSETKPRTPGISYVVTLTPGMIVKGNELDSLLTEVIGHEVGHLIDPNTSKHHGISTEPHFRKLLECFQKPDSIGMLKSQQGETIATYVSSELMVDQVNHLPPDQRKQKLLDYLKNICVADQNYHALSKDVKLGTEHPDPILEISGIFGANPRVRKVLGCTNESKKYRSCALHFDPFGSNPPKLKSKHKSSSAIVVDKEKQAVK